ncbi:MAG: hypothetical protein J6Q98_05595 [Bacteroidaceae bacterium]|nr:hypothetical protein [Bacteroidaceae bacterium]
MSFSPPAHILCNQDMCLKLLKENFTYDEVELIKADLLDDYPDYWPEEAVMRFFEQAMTDESLATGEESETRFRINYVHAQRMRTGTRMRASERTLYSKEKCRPPHKNRLIKGLIAYAGKRHHILAGNTFTATPFNMHPKKGYSFTTSTTLNTPSLETVKRTS